MEMSWKQRLVRSLPYVLVLLAAAGIAVTDEVRYAIFALVGLWLLPSPLTNTPNVSRETTVSDGLHFVCAECMTERDPNVSRETSSEVSDLPVPCPVMHGSADDHVLGCEGWTFPR